MGAHVLLNLSNELRKRDKTRGLPMQFKPCILSLFCNLSNKFNNTGARMLDSVYHRTSKLNKTSHFVLENVNILSFLRNVIVNVIT